MFVKLFPQKLFVRLHARMRGWELQSKILQQQDCLVLFLKDGECIFLWLYSWASIFCLVLEMLGHLPHGPPNEIRGIPIANSLAAMRSLARLHAKYFNAVRARGPNWSGQVYQSHRFKASLEVAQLNVDRFLSMMKGFEKEGYLPAGTMTQDGANFYSRAVKAYLCHVMLRQTPKELGGEHNTVLNHGDFRGGNMLLQGEKT